jgi:Bacterial pre-peptidase C-terminal domain
MYRSSLPYSGLKQSMAGLAIAAVFALLPSTGLSQVNVFLDYTNFQTRLNEATTAAGVANFNAGEVATIQANVLSSLTTSFAGYTVNFTNVNPGGVFETINFGLVGGGLGLADRLDFRNLVGNDVARVFTGNFGLFIESAETRGQQIQEFSVALGGTAAHEFSHNLGLEHRDPYGIVGAGVSNPIGGYITNGIQNVYIQATDITGISESQREVQRSFSDFSHVKLNFANNLTVAPLAPINEQGGPHGTPATAQHIVPSLLTTGNTAFLDAATVIGAISAPGQQDWYSFDLLAGEFLTAITMSEGFYTNDVDTVLTLFDTDGSTDLVENDDTEIGLNSVNPGDDLYATDSSIYNFRAATTGTYFLRVTGFLNDTGAYEMLFATNGVPEPGAALVLWVGLAGVFSFRRRPRNCL